MNPGYLLKHFDRLIEAPDAIANLRRFILDLAVRGKLVEQDPNDEPAAELLKRIEREKERLVKAGKIKSQDPLSQIEAEEIPFKAPAGWCWERLATISRRIHYGYTASSDKSIKDVRLLRITDIQDNSVDWLSVPGCVISKTETEQYKLEKSDILIARTGGTIGKTFLVREIPVTAVFASYLIRVQGSLELYDQYLKLFLESPVYWKQLQEGSRGSGQPNVNGQTLGKMVVPLPPLAEQHRIVARVDELMKLCDQMEAVKTEREQTRDRLVDSSLNGLNAPNASHDQVRFTFDNLARLTTRVEHIKQLRQTILNLAVRGKLVKQDPNDEPAAELLKKIEREKERLVREGENKKDVILPQMDLNRIPFKLPMGWSWARFPELGKFGRGKSKHRPRNDAALFDGGTHLVVQTGDVARSQGVIQSYTNKYNDIGLAQSMKWPAGTLCITIAANIADSGILSFDACFPDSVVGFVPASMFQNARYFEYFIRTAKANLIEFAPATAQKNINLEILNAVLVPLPPLAEQHRIVAKVDELMVLCDQLETQIQTTEAESRRFLEAVLHEALAENGDRVADLFAAPQAHPPQPATQRADANPSELVIPPKSVPVYIKHPSLNSKGRVAVDCYVLKVLGRDKYLGRTKMEKINHLVEYHCGLDLGRQPVRDQFGPVDYCARRDVESFAASQNWFSTLEGHGPKVDYLPGPEMPQALKLAVEFMGSKRAAVEALLELMRPLDTEKSEIVATLYASWNDFLLGGKTPTDEEIVNDVRNNWHPEKKKISASDWKKGLKWMRSKDLVPKGTGRAVPHRG